MPDMMEQTRRRGRKRPGVLYPCGNNGSIAAGGIYGRGMAYHECRNAARSVACGCEFDTAGAMAASRPGFALTMMTLCI